LCYLRQENIASHCYADSRERKRALSQDVAENNQNASNVTDHAQTTSHYRIHFEGQVYEVPVGTTVNDLLQGRKLTGGLPILGAIHNNKLFELGRPFDGDGDLHLINIEHMDGMRIYMRSLFFVMVKAARKLFRHATLTIEYGVSDGVFCTMEGLENLTGDEVKDLENSMRDIIQKDLPFIHCKMPREEAIEIFKQHSLNSKVKLFEHRAENTCSVYKLDGEIDYFNGYLAPSTGCVHSFSLAYQRPGFVLSFPSRTAPYRTKSFNEQPQFFAILRETHNWAEILEVQDVGQLNDVIQGGESDRLILVAEALHEKKLGHIADQIWRRQKVVKVVLIAGPSSSGKTTFVKRLMIQLRVCGIRPHAISLDDYFLDRDQTPRDQDGKQDFETINALNLPRFQADLGALLQGETVELPRYDFKTGQSVPSGEHMKLQNHDMILVEGLHCLNPELIKGIDLSRVYKIYISALNQINIDCHNRISTTDTRLIRRIVRDNAFRGYSARDTIARWPSVRHGENKNIFHFQEQSDIMFNSALIYELAVLKTVAEPLLRTITRNMPEFLEAHRLLKFFSFFRPVKPSLVPSTSILREFIGGSRFKY
jgi:uridine kinase